MNGSERRHYGRRPLFRTLELWQSGERVSSGRTINASPGGACAVMRKPLCLKSHCPLIASVQVPAWSRKHRQFDQVQVPVHVCWTEDLGDALAVAVKFEVDIDLT